jgi:hypothetical protein
VNSPFHSASNSLVMPTSAGSSLAGHIGEWLLAQPTLVAPARRSSIAARPWPRSRWWATGNASNIIVRPGACWPRA